MKLLGEVTDGEMVSRLIIENVVGSYALTLSKVEE
jgi:hypothetical protein